MGYENRKETTDEAVLGELGRRLAQVRLGKNLTQAQLAAKAGVSKRTVERLEVGGGATVVGVSEDLSGAGFAGALRAPRARTGAEPDGAAQTRRQATAPGLVGGARVDANRSNLP